MSFIESEEYIQQEIGDTASALENMYSLELPLGLSCCEWQGGFRSFLENSKSCASC